MIWLGLASNYSALDILHHSFCIGKNKDYTDLELALSKKYGAPLEKTTLIYSGRSAIALALKSLLEAKKITKKDYVGVNAFTCRAVIEAIDFVGLKPYYLDIERTSPNFSPETLRSALKSEPKLKVVILQNTFGETVDDKKFLALKKKYSFYLLEDLAHCAGTFYPSKKEVGTIGDATCLSFGKGKTIDTITGGALILRNKDLSFPKSFDKKNLVKRAKNGDTPRASWYPLFGAIARGLSYLHLEKFWLGLLLKLRFIERSADTALSLSRTITNWQAKLALSQLKSLKKTKIRDYYLVFDQTACLKELRKHSCRLEEFWYSTPVAPERYYKQLNFPEDKCKNAVFFSSHVLNLPNWYNSPRKSAQVERARKIIKKYEIK